MGSEDAPVQSVQAPSGARRHRVWVVVVALVVVLVVGWFAIPWVGPFGLKLGSPGNEAGFCPEKGEARTWSVGTIYFDAQAARGVRLEGIELSADATNMRLLDARVAMIGSLQDTGAGAIGGVGYPPVGPDLFSQETWDALPPVKGFQPDPSGDAEHYLVIGVEQVDPDQVGLTDGFRLRYHQYLRDFTVPTGIVVRANPVGTPCG